MRCRRLLPFALVLLCAAVPPLLADQVVYFVNGKAIMAKSVEKGDKFTILEMEGGGKVGVPTDQIVRIEDYVVSAPQAPQVPPAQAAPVPLATAPIALNPSAAVAVPAAVAPGSSAAAPSLAAGPGVGGRSLAGPGESLANIRPLDIGGNNPDQRPQRPIPQAGAGPRVGGPGGPMLGMAGRPNFAAGRKFGRGPNPGGRGGRSGMVEAGRTPPPPAAQTTPTAPPPQTTQPPADPSPTPTAEPEAPPVPPDAANEEPPEPPAPEEGDSSGNSPGSAS